MELRTKQVFATMLSITGAIGVLSTMILTRKAALKEVVPEEKETVVQTLKRVTPDYIPAIVVGGVTIGSIVGSTVLSHKVQTSVMSMAMIADQGWRKYKNQVKETLGFDTHSDILRKIKKGDTTLKDARDLYYEEHIGYFQAKPEDVMSAYAQMNELWITDPDTKKITLKNFLELSNGNVLNTSKWKSLMDEYGWTRPNTWTKANPILNNEAPNWIRMDMVDDTTDDGEMPIKIISWLSEPVMLPKNDSFMYENDEPFDNPFVDIPNVDMEEN